MQRSEVPQLSLSQTPRGFGACYRGFAPFLARSICLKTAKLHRLGLTRGTPPDKNCEEKQQIFFQYCFEIKVGIFSDCLPLSASVFYIIFLPIISSKLSKSTDIRSCVTITNVASNGEHSFISYVHSITVLVII